MSDKSYDCWNCCDAGCPCCEEQKEVHNLVDRINAYCEPWPKETWLDMPDGEIEQLVCDGLDELKRRGKVNQRLEEWFAL